MIKYLRLPYLLQISRIPCDALFFSLTYVQKSTLSWPPVIDFRTYLCTLSVTGDQALDAHHINLRTVATSPKERLSRPHIYGHLLWYCMFSSDNG